MEFLHSKKLSHDGTGASTLKYVDVEEVRDGVIVLKNGALRAILAVSSINFDLKATDEQDAIVGQYQNFLNSLDFPTQIIISSRRLDIKPYLEFLKNKEGQIANELLRLQITEYMNFVKNLAEVSNIMSKFFYVIVPFSPVETKEGGLFHKLTSIFSPRQAVLEKRENFETYENQLWQRVDHVTAGLSGIGVRITPLKTEEVIELLYNSYNPSLYTKAIAQGTKNLDLRI